MLVYQRYTPIIKCDTLRHPGSIPEGFVRWEIHQQAQYLPATYENTGGYIPQNISITSFLEYAIQSISINICAV